MPLIKKWTRTTKIALMWMLVLVTMFVLYTEIFQKNEVEAAKVGRASPEFTLKDGNGVEHSLSDYQGKGVIINFWATYCPPCEKEMPNLEKAYKQNKHQGIEILAINVAEPTRVVNQFASTKNLSFPILLDRDGVVTEQYQVQNLPITFVVDDDGKIVKIVYGELSEEKIDECVELINSK